MYQVFPSKRGYAIYFVEYGERAKNYISDGLSRKQANKWCERLNTAYIMGYANS